MPAARGTLRRNQTVRVEEQILHRAIEPDLLHPGHAIVERVDSRVERIEVEDVAGRHIGAGDVDRGCGRAVCHPKHIGRAAAIDHRIGDERCDDLGAKRMGLDVRRIGSGHLARKIAEELIVERLVGGDATGEEIDLEGDLGEGEEDAELGSGQRQSRLLTLDQRRIVGKRLDLAIEEPAPFEILHQAALEAEILEAPALGERDGESLLIVVAKDEARRPRRSSRPAAGRAASCRAARRGLPGQGRS